MPKDSYTVQAGRSCRGIIISTAKYPRPHCCLQDLARHGARRKKIRKGAEADRRKNRDKLGQVKKARLPEWKIKL